MLLRKLPTSALTPRWSGADPGGDVPAAQPAVFVSMAIAIALGATAWRYRGAGPARAGLGAALAAPRSGAPSLADARTLARIARPGGIRAHVWKLIADAAGSPAGHRRDPAGWLVIDMDATLITAYSDKEGRPTWRGYGFHPLGRGCHTRECLAMLLRPGRPDTFTDTGGWPRPSGRSPPFRARSGPRRRGRGQPDLISTCCRCPPRAVLLFTCGWMITQPTRAIRRPRRRVEPGRPGRAAAGQGVAEITPCDRPGTGRAAAVDRPAGRRRGTETSPIEETAGYRSPAPTSGHRVAGVPQHTPSTSRVHREHAVVETRVARQSMGLRLPSKPGRSTALGPAQHRADRLESAAPHAHWAAHARYSALRRLPATSDQPLHEQHYAAALRRPHPLTSSTTRTENTPRRPPPAPAHPQHTTTPAHKDRTQSTRESNGTRL